MLILFCHVKFLRLEDRLFYLTGIKFKTGAEKKGWIHAVENNPSISKLILIDLANWIGLQLIVRVKVKTLRKNLKTPTCSSIFKMFLLAMFGKLTLIRLSFWEQIFSGDRSIRPPFPDPPPPLPFIFEEEVI